MPAVVAARRAGPRRTATARRRPSRRTIGAEMSRRERPKGVFSPELLHEVFLNPGLFLLFGGILIGFISGLQGASR